MPDDFGDSILQNGALAVGASASGSIEVAGDRDWFKTSLVAGVTYEFLLVGSQFGGTRANTLPDPILRLRNSVGGVLSTDDNGYGRNATLTYTPTITGDYYLDVGSAVAGDTGTYQVSARRYASIPEMADYLINGFWNWSSQQPNHANDKPRHWATSSISVNVSALSQAEQAVAAAVLQIVQDVCNLVFTFTTSAAQLTYTSPASGSSEGGSVYNSLGEISSSFVKVVADPAITPAINTQAFTTYLHETAHALGLGHSGPYNGGSVSYGFGNDVANDTLKTTVMTYFGWPSQQLHDHVVTFQMADIYALQAVYGANNATRSGDTVYGFHSTAGAIYDFALYGPQIAFTIYESGGVDTLDASGYAMAQTIDLRPGAYSSIGGYRDNIGIYLTTNIEIGIGGSGADSLYGGSIDNTLIGGAGNDAIDGGAGTDIASYSGSSGSYTWSRNTDSSWTVRDTRGGSPDGIDALTRIEKLKFSDITVALSLLPPGVEVALANITRADGLATISLTLVNDLVQKLATGALTSTTAIAAIVSAADATTSVATLAYQFFTGHIPGGPGYDYLVSPTGPNANNLNSAYYQSFNLENRYINFAVNLGKLGEGKDAFAASYGSKTLFEATKSAYATIFGGTPTDAKVHALLDPTFSFNGQTITRADYFGFYGQDGANGIGTKAAMVGWLMAEAEKADIGMYARANAAFLTDLADGATFGVDLVGVYGRPEFVYSG